MKIQVLSRHNFVSMMQENSYTDDNISMVNTFFICIEGLGDDHYFKNIHKNVLNLEFDDDYEEYPETKCFSINDAKLIVNNLSIMSNYDNIIIHCAAGISRSGAVGEFLAYHFNVHEEFYNEHVNKILPNPLVLKILNKTYNENEKF